VVGQCLHRVCGLVLSLMNLPVKTTEVSMEFSTSGVHLTMVWKYCFLCFELCIFVLEALHYLFWVLFFISVFKNKTYETYSEVDFRFSLYCLPANDRMYDGCHGPSIIHHLSCGHILKTEQDRRKMEDY